MNAPYLIKYGTVELLCAILDETYEEANARKITMTMLLALSYLLDDNNQERIVPSEGKLENARRRDLYLHIKIFIWNTYEELFLTHSREMPLFCAP